MSLKYKKNEIKIIYFQHDVLPIQYKILGDIKEWYFFKILIEGMARFFFGLLFMAKELHFLNVLAIIWQLFLECIA